MGETTKMRDYSEAEVLIVKRSFAESIRATVQELFLERLVVVAGGCVRDILKACPPKDYDVFILGCENPNEMKEEIAKRLADAKFQAAGNVHHISEPYLAGTYLVGGYHVQVMASDYKSMDELIDSFDWNVSRFAFDGERIIGEWTGEIGTGGTLKLHKLTFPYSTLRRGFRFSERFRMNLPLETVEQICEAILKLKKEREEKREEGPEHA